MTAKLTPILLAIFLLSITGNSFSTPQSGTTSGESKPSRKSTDPWAEHLSMPDGEGAWLVTERSSYGFEGLVRGARAFNSAGDSLRRSGRTPAIKGKMAPEGLQKLDAALRSAHPASWGSYGDAKTADVGNSSLTLERREKGRVVTYQTTLNIFYQHQIPADLAAVLNSMP